MTWLAAPGAAGCPPWCQTGPDHALGEDRHHHAGDAIACSMEPIAGRPDGIEWHEAVSAGLTADPALTEPYITLATAEDAAAERRLTLAEAETAAALLLKLVAAARGS